MNGHLGILGGGQLGRLLALAAHRLGVEVRVLDPDPTAPAATVARTLQAPFDDAGAVAWLADGAAAVTWEREDIPTATLAAAAARARVWPDPSVLERTQDRAAQKRLIAGLGLPTAPWVEIAPDATTPPPLPFAFPVVVKARRGGFDGRGQRIARDAAGLAAAIADFARSGAIIEPLVRFDDEVAALTARRANGEQRTWAPVLTRQVDGQLASAEAPHPEHARIGARAATIASTLAEALDHVGVLAVECFRCGDELIVNELAPRVHNSGHWTPEGSACGQFEQHVRAVLGLPLGDCRSLGVAGLVNCVGALPDLANVLAVPGASLTVYGKRARPGRKLGHVTVVAPDADAMRSALAAIRAHHPLPLPDRTIAC